MKFTKTAVAVAIAGIAAAPMMAAAETTLSGAVQINLEGSDIDDNLDTPDVNEEDSGDIQFAAGDVNVQLNAQQQLTSGITGFGNFRLDADSFSGGDLSGDSIFLGVRGGFGEFRFGEAIVVSEYGQVSNDIFDITGDIDDGVSYEGSFGGFGIGLSWAPNDNTDVVGVGLRYSIGGFALAAGWEERENDVAFSVGGSFAFAGFNVAAHFGSTESGAEPGEDEVEITGVCVGYGIGKLGISVTLMNQDNSATGFENVARLDVGYDLGGGLNISSRVTTNMNSVETFLNGDEKGDFTEYRIQLAKSF